MKKFLLILLSLILILLPSCNLSTNDDETEKFITKESFSYPKIELSEEGKQELKSKIESEYCRDIDISEASTNISIVSAKVINVSTVNFLQSITNVEQPSDFNWDTNVLEISNIIMFGEELLYSEREEKYIYLFIDIPDGTDRSITKCNTAMLSEGEFCFDFNNAYPEDMVVPDMESSDLVILVIDSSSLNGDLRTAKVTVTKDN